MSDLPPGLRRAREMWEYRGEGRPRFAVEPGKGQESVWDYPRPPRVEPDDRRVKVLCVGVVVADTQHAVRVLETASPPTFYIPPEDVRMEHLESSPRTSMCEWKGQADYWSVCVGERFIEGAAWRYPEPLAGYELIADYFSFYASKVDCYVDGQRATPQPGGFYGGWLTAEIVGPFKGEPGTGWW